ncbi:unnamed protein product [Linum tenue]|uniref:Peptidase A1 domain-containing protein n=1 Tax=Linum tenue TaxID=586396 RepID=A0AAV0KMA6_9ROSI|nr:unnamed protein product [Linum tenue]
MRADISSWMWFLFTLAVILAAVSPSSSTVSFLTTNVLHWEMTRLPNMDQLRAQDRATHAHLFSGVPDLYVFGSAVPDLYGIYYTKVKLGSPPQEFSLQIDTGSDLLWVNAKSCANCPRSSSFTMDFGGMWCNRLGEEARSDYLRRSCSKRQDFRVRFGPSVD